MSDKKDNTTRNLGIFVFILFCICVYFHEPEDPNKPYKYMRPFKTPNGTQCYVVNTTGWTHDEQVICD